MEYNNFLEYFFSALLIAFLPSRIDFLLFFWTPSIDLQIFEIDLEVFGFLGLRSDKLLPLFIFLSASLCPSVESHGLNSVDNAEVPKQLARADDLPIPWNGFEESST